MVEVMNSVAASPPSATAALLDVAELEVQRSDDGLDLSLIDHYLAMTPWERMLANDAALNFAEELQEAMRQHHAQSQANGPANLLTT